MPPRSEGRGIGHRPSARGALPPPTTSAVELVPLNVRVPDDLRRALKREALEVGVTLQQLVTERLATHGTPGGSPA